MKNLAKTVIACVLSLGVASPAFAYVGPGAGLSLIGALWGLLAAVGAALAFVLFWPIKRLIRWRREKATSGNASSGNEGSAQDAVTANTSADRTPHAKNPAQQV
ncbi:MAG: hypothetical protein H0V34_08820 [Gammaproteobacteria bacterium]|nr:hypothetical protein [Gammaproteobacteria bacterium]MBA3732450.1 hypothetical protein [Gammaproteobacteria bacterium]